MKKTLSVILLAALTTLSTNAQSTKFLPKHLAVLRAGDGVLDLHLKQSPIFLDQFELEGGDQTPSLSVAIPTNGPNTLFFNGHAATEGDLSRSADRKLLGFAGYSGANLLQFKGAPSLLDIKRAFLQFVDAGRDVCIPPLTASMKVEKMNPRGVATDGTNNFWGCGNAFGTVYYSPGASSQLVELKAMPSSRSIKIIGGVLYATMNGADSTAADSVAGIYSFGDKTGNAVALPRAEDSSLKLLVGSAGAYTKVVGFDINQGATIGAGDGYHRRGRPEAM